MSKKVIQEITVTECEGDRLDVFLSRKTVLSRSAVQRMIKEGLITVNGASKTSKYMVMVSDIIEIMQNDTDSFMDIPVIFEDDDIIVINKPAGVTSHPAPSENERTVYDYFISEYSGPTDLGRNTFAMIVHRLDKGTSGVMLLAKNPKSMESLRIQFKNRQVEKTYVALVEGMPKSNKGSIDLPILRDVVDRGRFSVGAIGREAQTNFDVIESRKSHTLLYALPKTGRTHQIRVHFSSLGLPLSGDIRYGGAESGAGILLHAHKISFYHPSTNKRVEFSAPLPDNFLRVLREFGFSDQTLSNLA